MTPRSVRRAAEREVRKEAERKEAERKARNGVQLYASNDQPLNPDEQPTTEAAAEPQPVSSARLIANRANAQLSTGPATDKGRAKTCLNAIKTALTGRTVLLPSDDAHAYEQHVLAYTKELRPLTQRECDLAQSLADTAWCLKRIPGLEMAIFAQGRVEFADTFPDYQPSARPGMIELKTFLTYEKQLRNLQLQEARLARRYEKDSAELRKIQAERDQREAADLDDCSKLYLAAQHDRKPFQPSDFGFEFSTEDIEQYLEGVRAAKVARTMTKHRAQAA